MPSSSTPSITNLPAFLTFAARQDARPDSPIPDAVVNEQCTAATGWLYGERRDSIELHRARLGIRYTAEERELLQALRDVVSASHGWASADTCTAADDGDRTSEPLTARIYRARSQGTLYRAHLPVMAQLAARATREKAPEASDGTSSPPSGT